MFGLGDKLFSLEEWNRSRQAWNKVMENLKNLQVAGGSRRKLWRTYRAYCSAIKKYYC